MAWNEPGGGKQDPWGSRGSNQGPPDLDEIIRKMQSKLGGIFGGGGGRRSGAGEGAGGIAGLIIAVLIGWIIYDSTYIIQPAERGVVTIFGEYTKELQQGMSFVPPRPIGKVVRVDVDQIRSIEIGYRTDAAGQSEAQAREALMLTQDENIVDIKLAVQYRVKSASDYLFNLQNPDDTLREVTESALREIVGKSTMDFVLTEGRREIAERVQELLQNVMDTYKSGIIVTSVNLQDAQPPEQVQHAFADAVKAREDEQRFKNEAEAYANDIIPKARGAAARQLEEANAYKSRVTAEAEGSANRFNQILTEYRRAPEVTRKRLYLETVQQVLANSSKVMVAAEGGNNLIYLPLDRLMGREPAASFAAPQLPAPAQEEAQPKVDFRSRDALRSRGER
ncbi:MAG: FtsH protease activity modulator HflK [Pseudomonadota bacterium]